MCQYPIADIALHLLDESYQRYRKPNNERMLSWRTVTFTEAPTQVLIITLLVGIPTL